MSQSIFIHGVKDIILSEVKSHDEAIWRDLKIVDEEGYTITISMFGANVSSLSISIAK